MSSKGNNLNHLEIGNWVKEVKLTPEKAEKAQRLTGEGHCDFTTCYCGRICKNIVNLILTLFLLTERGESEEYKNETFEELLGATEAMMHAKKQEFSCIWNHQLLNELFMGLEELLGQIKLAAAVTETHHTLRSSAPLPLKGEQIDHVKKIFVQVVLATEDKTCEEIEANHQNPLTPKTLWERLCNKCGEILVSRVD